MIDLSPAARVVVTLCFMALLVAASVTPAGSGAGGSFAVRLVARTPNFLQKVLHVTLYGVLTLLLVWNLAAIPSHVVRLLIAVAVATGFGAAMEWYQTRVPGRFGTVFDVGLDATGALLGAGAAFLLLRAG